MRPPTLGRAGAAMDVDMAVAVAVAAPLSP